VVVVVVVEGQGGVSSGPAQATELKLTQLQAREGGRVKSQQEEEEEEQEEVEGKSGVCAEKAELQRPRESMTGLPTPTRLWS